MPSIFAQNFLFLGFFYPLYQIYGRVYCLGKRSSCWCETISEEGSFNILCLLKEIVHLHLLWLMTYVVIFVALRKLNLARNSLSYHQLNV